MGNHPALMRPWEEWLRPGNSADDILITGACSRGSRHTQEGTPCQDAWICLPVHNGGWVIVAADGLSTARHAREGAEMAVQTAGEALARSCSEQQQAGYEPGVLIRQAAGAAHQIILQKAAEQGEHPSSFASTLIIALCIGETVSVGHIGDGIVAGVREGENLILSAPQQGEYANETACLMQHDWEDHLRLGNHELIEACIIATDGCQGAVAVREKGGYQPYDPFITPLLSFVRQRLIAGHDPRPDLAALLLSPRMETLSGDDKTLIIMVHRERPDP